MFKFSYPDTLELIGTLIQLKKDYGIKNDTIAAVAGVSETTVSKWLNFKAKTIHKETKEKLENFIAETWRPGLVCVTKFGEYPHDLFFNVGSVYDPFFTWITRPQPGIQKFLEDCEKAIAEGRAKKYIVKYYRDMDEANTIGREEEEQYTIGAMTGGRTDIQIHFIDHKDNKVVTKNSLVFTPPEDA